MGNSKPEFNQFLDPIVNNLKELELGILFKINENSSKIFKSFLLFGVYDKPARSGVNNIIYPTGSYCCVKCPRKGTRLKNEKSNYFVYLSPLTKYSIHYYIFQLKARFKYILIMIIILQVLPELNLTTISM